MIKKIMESIDLICKRFNLDCELSNAEHFILSIGEDDVSLDETYINLKLNKFENRAPWDEFRYGVDQGVSEEFLECFAHRIGWDIISKAPLSEKFILRHMEKLNWIAVTRMQKLSEEVMEQCCDKINWKLASFNQEMSEPFIEKHADKLDWVNISLTKKLSSEFILKHEKKLNMTYVRMKNKLNFSYIKNLY